MFFSSYAENIINGVYHNNQFTKEKLHSNSHISWSILQHPNNYMHAVSGGNLVKYDGTKWLTVLDDKTRKFISITFDSKGSIYICPNSEFGVIALDSLGNCQFESLNYKFKNIEISAITDITSIGNDIYLLHKGGVLLLNSINHKHFEITRTHKLFNYNNTIFFSRIIPDYGNKKGIFYIDNSTKIKKLLPFPPIENDDFVGLIKTPSGNYIVITMLGIYHYDTQLKDYTSIPKKFESIKDLLSFATPYHMLVNQDFISVSTFGAGTFTFRKDGSYIAEFNDKHGVLNNQHLDHTFDNNGNLWIASAEGIIAIDLPFTFSFWSKVNQLKGLIVDIVEFKGKTYISSFEGVYILSDGKVEQINKDKDQFFEFAVVNNRLLVSSLKQDFEVIDNQLFKLNNSLDVNKLYSINDKVICLENNMVYAFNLKGKSLLLEDSVKINTLDSYSIILNNKMWIRGDKQLFCISHSSISDNKPTVKEYFFEQVSDHKEARPFLYNDKIRLVYNNVIYDLNEES